MSDKKYYFKVDKRYVAAFNGDLVLAFWYSALKDYQRRFKPDKLGFVRVSSATFEEDFGFYRMKVWRLNQKLEDAGYIVVDKVSRGGRRYIGFKVLK